MSRRQLAEEAAHDLLVAIRISAQRQRAHLQDCELHHASRDEAMAMSHHAQTVRVLEALFPGCATDEQPVLQAPSVTESERAQVLNLLEERARRRGPHPGSEPAL